MLVEAPRADADAVVAELVALSERVPSLLQFRSRAGAHQFRPAWRAVDAHLAPGARVLDWGSGNGHFAYFLARRGFDVTAYGFGGEPKLPGAHYAFVAGLDDPVRLPFSDARFDAVCSIGVLEHVRETGGREEPSLREIRRVLRPGGLFLCFHLPNRWSAIEALASLVPGKHVHPYRYGRRAVRRLFAAAGFELLALERYGVLPRNAARRLPGRWRTSARVARAWDRLDDALRAPLGAVSQNFGVVARARPEAPPAASA